MDVRSRHQVRVSGREGGPVVMLAHGFGCDQNMWRLVVPALERDFRVVLFDHVGAGRSDLSAWSKERHSSLDGYVEDVLEICRELDLGPVTFVGHSVSAMMGVLAAARRPEYFESLVLLAPSPASSTTPLPATVAASAPRTSRNSSNLWTRTTSAGRVPWPRSSWATRTAPSWARS